MLISYNWLKWYIPEVPEPEKLAEVFSYHLCEVESLEKIPDKLVANGEDAIFDINILPNRAHDLLSHQGVARELASLLNIRFIDPMPKYKIPKSQPTKLEIAVKSEKCRRYMGRIVRNIKVGPSPDWVVADLEAMGQRSINNIVDAANIVMFDCGQPVHAFDLDKMGGKLIIRQAKNGENLITLDNRDWKLKSSDLVIADKEHVLAVAGIKGGKKPEVDDNTKNIILEVANFNPTSIRKTAQAFNIATDARKRFENDLSPELGSFAMQELSSLILEMCPDASFEEIIDVYPEKQETRKLSFGVEKVSKILGLNISIKEIEDILKRYCFEYKENNGKFEVVVPPMRLDLTIEEDMAEEIGRILGYDKVNPKVPKVQDTWKPKQNEIYSKILWARQKLLNDGYSEVMTYVFRDQGEVEVLASASDKKFLRTNLSDALKVSMNLNNINFYLFGVLDTKIFEIGTIFKKGGEEMHIAYGDKKEIKETSLEQFISPEFMREKVLPLGSPRQDLEEHKFKMWSLFPFIARDVAVWVPEGVKSEEVSKIIKENMGDMVIRGPELFDEFKKGSQVSYAFRLVFQSCERTLTDPEVNEIMTKITNKIKDKKTNGIGWQVR
ncbi:phenylalanine--tRNA ligase subunit beta [Patescibacteria group bacterium]|nr:phenylalanine--tRNA ligase subunit beta [Patescibacteria group bacterium]